MTGSGFVGLFWLLLSVDVLLLSEKLGLLLDVVLLSDKDVVVVALLLVSAEDICGLASK